MFGYTLLFSACLNLLFIAPTLYMLQIYDRVVPTEGKTTLALLTLVLVGAIAALSLLDGLRSRLLVRAAARLERSLADAVLKAGLQCRTAAGSKRTADIRELDTLRSALSGPAVSAICDTPWTPIYVLVAFVIHPWVGYLAAGGLVLILLIAWFNDRVTRVPLWQAANAAALSYASYESSSSAAANLAALGMMETRVKHHLHERQEMVALQTRAGLSSTSLSSLSKFVRLLLQSLALGTAALLAIDHQISAGAMFASMFIVGRALAPVAQLLASWKGILHARRAYHDLSDLFDQTAPDCPHTHLPAPQGALSVTGLGVEDSQFGRVTLSGIGFGLTRGEVLGIIGPSGAGKSTLVGVLAGAQAPSLGEVRFDGADRSDWDPEALGRHMGFMAQEPSLFAGTLKENIARFQVPQDDNGEALDQAVVEAAKRAGAHEMILGLPGGYDYRLSWGGRGLSAGQAQQVALARALFGSPAYLLLDEPNAHLDAEADVQLVGSLTELKAEGVTMVIVAHKLNVLAIADKVLLLDRGRMRMFGPREDVLRQLALAQPPRAVPTTASAA